MGQNPSDRFPRPVTRAWASRWYASNQNFAGMLAEDLEGSRPPQERLKAPPCRAS